MASTHLYYYDRQDGVSLCFNCALKKAAFEHHKIVIKSTDYEFERCEVCGDYIEDKIDI